MDDVEHARTGSMPRSTASRAPSLTTTPEFRYVSLTRYPLPASLIDHAQLESRPGKAHMARPLCAARTGKRHVTQRGLHLPDTASMHPVAAGEHLPPSRPEHYARGQRIREISLPRPSILMRQSTRGLLHPSSPNAIGFARNGLGRKMPTSHFMGSRRLFCPTSIRNDARTPVRGRRTQQAICSLQASTS